MFLNSWSDLAFLFVAVLYRKHIFGVKCRGLFQEKAKEKVKILPAGFTVAYIVLCFYKTLPVVLL